MAKNSRMEDPEDAHTTLRITFPNHIACWHILNTNKCCNQSATTEFWNPAPILV